MSPSKKPSRPAGQVALVGTGTGDPGLLAARVFQDKGNADAAKSSLAWVADNASDEGHKAVARLRLAAVLVGITAAFGLLTGVLLRAPLGQVLGLYAIGILINALPEELFFRGMLLPRLEKIFSNPLNALVISA